MSAADLHPDTREVRPSSCCGACPPIAGGGYDCTCEGNPRCSETTTGWGGYRVKWDVDRAETTTATTERLRDAIERVPKVGPNAIYEAELLSVLREARDALLATARTRPTDPTDAQVLAALNAMHPRAAAPSLDYWGGKADEMRTALRAAWTEADQ